MKLDVRHFYPCSPERYWEMYWDSSFDDLLMTGSTFDRDVVEEREEGGMHVRRLRFTPHDTLPRPVAKIVGSDRLVYEQLNTFDRERGVLSWKVLPTFLDAKYAKKVTAGGTLSAVAAAGGCESVAAGDISVNVMFIGGQVEKQILGQIKEAYDRMAVLGGQWLGENSKASS